MLITHVVCLRGFATDWLYGNYSKYSFYPFMYSRLEEYGGTVEYKKMHGCILIHKKNTDDYCLACCTNMKNVTTVFIEPS